MKNDIERKDVVTQIRLKSTTVAHVALFLRHQGFLFNSAASVVRMGLETLEASLINSGKLEEIETVIDARSTLRRLGVLDKSLNVGNRGKYSFTKQLELEDHLYEVKPTSATADLSTTESMRESRVEGLDELAKRETEKYWKEKAKGDIVAVGSGVESIEEGQERREREAKEMKENHEKMLADLRKEGEDNVV